MLGLGLGLGYGSSGGDNYSEDLLLLLFCKAILIKKMMGKQCVCMCVRARVCVSCKINHTCRCLPRLLFQRVLLHTSRVVKYIDSSL